MRLSSLPMLLSGLLSCLLLLQSTVAHPPLKDKRAFSTVDAFKTFEYPVALNGLFANIGPSGSKASGAAAGVVLASPSKSSPNYWYMWIRDSSLVYKYIIDRYVSGRDTTLLSGIQTWVSAMAQIQQVTNPSGSVSSGGLGEPKFNADLTAFTDGWGRPQRDGPALRATAMITLANKLLADGSSSYVTGTLWPVILLDLNYVANNWNSTTYDLWEEVNGASFFTTAVQHRSLRQGITLATALGQTSYVSSWTTQANNIFCFQQSYWSSSSGYTVANVNPGSGAIRSGKDSNTVLTSIHTFDPSAGCDDKSFQPCSSKALASLKVYVDSFRSIYSINSGIASNAAVSTGRYPEDSYYGGNPWYLCTFAVAEQLYRALQVWNAQGQGITVTSVSLPFFQQFDSSVTASTIAAGSTQYTSLTTSIKTFADGFMLIAAQYTPSTGALAEQYIRSSGVPTSAADLTWSYASVLTAFDARDGLAAESWGVGNVTLPTTCSTGSDSGGGGGSGSATVVFKVTAYTNYGQNIYVTGSIDALSNWSTGSAIGPFDNTNTYPVWSKTISIPAGSSFSYKYIKNDGSNVVWESDPNRSTTAPAAGATLTLTDTWR